MLPNSPRFAVLVVRHFYVFLCTKNLPQSCHLRFYHSCYRSLQKKNACPHHPKRDPNFHCLNQSPGLLQPLSVHHGLGFHMQNHTLLYVHRMCFCSLFHCSDYSRICCQLLEDLKKQKRAQQ